MYIVENKGRWGGIGRIEFTVNSAERRIIQNLRQKEEKTMAATKYTETMFDQAELTALRAKFNYVDTDIKGHNIGR